MSCRISTITNMSGRGKGGKTKTKTKSRSSRAGLQFPVGRIHRLLRWDVDFCVSIFFMMFSCLAGKATMPRELGQELPSTWLQWWNTWLLRSWSLLATLPGTTRSPGSSQGTSSWRSGFSLYCFGNVYGQLSWYRNDEELNKLMAGVTIAQGGVLPNIQVFFKSSKNPCLHLDMLLFKIMHA